MGINLQDGFRELYKHIGHEIEVVLYQGEVNTAIECITCGEVLLDFNQPTVVCTEDGYQFELQKDGKWSDGDITYDSLDQLAEHANFIVIEDDAMPWCEPCQSYHSPKAPGCVARKKRRR